MFVRELQTCSWTIKTEDDPFIKKKEKSSIQGGQGSICSGMGWGKKKKISPKDAMYLVVVL